MEKLNENSFSNELRLKAKPERERVLIGWKSGAQRVSQNFSFQKIRGFDSSWFSNLSD